MAENPSSSPSSAHSSPDSRIDIPHPQSNHNSLSSFHYEQPDLRKRRVGKACDACRIKKTKVFIIIIFYHSYFIDFEINFNFIFIV